VVVNLLLKFGIDIDFCFFWNLLQALWPVIKDIPMMGERQVNADLSAGFTIVELVVFITSIGLLGTIYLFLLNL
jgi:hypothetical protein